MQKQKKDNAVSSINSNAELIKEIAKTIKLEETEIAKLKSQQVNVRKQLTKTKSEALKLSNQLRKCFNRSDEIRLELKNIGPEIGVFEVDQYDKNHKLESCRDESERKKLTNELK